MRRRPTVAWLTLVMALTLIGAQAAPAAAAGVSFGAKLTTSSQPRNTDSGRSCDEEGGIPPGATCTWVAVSAFENGSNAAAPKIGTIGKLKLVTCIAGSFTLQIMHKISGGRYKVVRSGPTISYAADPFVADGDEDTFCGGEDQEFVVQSFAVTVPVRTGDLIGVRAGTLGPISCSGGNGVRLITPALSTGQSSVPDDSTSCDLMIRLTYK